MALRNRGDVSIASTVGTLTFTFSIFSEVDSFVIIGFVLLQSSFSLLKRNSRWRYEEGVSFTLAVGGRGMECVSVDVFA